MLDIFDGLGAGNLGRPEILYEETILRIGPQGSIKKVAGTDGIDLDAILDQFHGEGLGQTHAPKLAARIGPVAIRALQTTLGVDLNDVTRIGRIGLVLPRQD